ncbi:hypothetical protein [Pseudomonas sp. NFX98]|uniref:hypothetical protein n=1 Tax=Pseudomonas sp. NFX98 TaxID=3399122 RepID=UPI0039FC805B
MVIALGEIFPLVVLVRIHKAAFPISHQSLVDFCALFVVEVVPVFFRAKPPPILQIDNSTFRVFDLVAVIDSLGLHGEYRGRSVVPFNAGAVAVINRLGQRISSS